MKTEKRMSKKKKYQVRFLPSGKSIKVPPGYNLRQAILDSGLTIDSSCGGVGTCGRCMVRVLKGSADSKKTLLREAGATVVDSPADIGATLAAMLSGK